MLHDPLHGWATIRIGDFEDVCSYVQDIPVYLWQALNNAVDTWDVSCVSIDAEGYQYIIVFDLCETHIIMNATNGDGFVLKSFQIDILDLAREFIADIRRDLPLWAEWENCGDMTQEQIETHKRELIALCGLLEGKINNAEKLRNAETDREEQIPSDDQQDQETACH